MSLQKIGKLKSAFGSGSKDSISKAIGEFSDFDSAIKWISRFNTDANGNDILSQKKLIKTIQGKFADKSKDNIKDALKEAASGESSSIIGSLFGGAGLKSGIKNIGSGLASIVAGFGPAILASILAGVAFKAVKGIWDYGITDNAATKKSQESAQKYETSKSELESLQSEYDSNKSRIQELRAKENRTLDESAELDNLRSQNQLLDSQLKTKESIVTADQEQNAADAKAKIEKKSARWEKGLGKGVYNTEIEAAQDYIDAIDQLTYDQWQVDKYQRASDKLSDSRDYKEKNNYKGSGNDLTENDYLNAIKTNDKTAIALNNRRNDIINQMSQYSENSTQYQDLAKDLADINSSIIDTANSTAELKKSIVDLRFKAFSDIQDDLNDYIDNLNDLQDMMDSDTFLNDDGSFTKQGLSNILLISKEMDAYKQQIVDYRQQLSEVQELYDNHMITLDEYEDATKDAVSNINKASKSLYSSQQNMLKAYEDQITKVNKSLQDNIDKRKDALSAKKDYYDYDKTLKDKNKDINTLKAQIAALEGTTNASAKARLAQLKADLKDKEDDLADTKYEHQIDLESKGYDNLSEQANDALDKTLQAVKSNTELQKSVINNMLKEVQNSYSDAYSNIQKTIEDTGYKTSDMFDDLIKKAQLTNKTISEIPTNVPKTNTDEIDSQRPDKSGSDNAVNNALNSQDPSGSNSTVETIEQRQTREQAEAAAAAAQKAKAAVESAANTKSKLQEWYNSVPTGKVTSSKFKEKHHDFYYYFWKKNKKVGQKDFEQVAKILGHEL